MNNPPICIYISFIPPSLPAVKKRLPRSDKEKSIQPPLYMTPLPIFITPPPLKLAVTEDRQEVKRKGPGRTPALSTPKSLRWKFFFSENSLYCSRKTTEKVGKSRLKCFPIKFPLVFPRGCLPFVTRSFPARKLLVKISKPLPG